jgi:hypothetical protein
VPFADLFFGKGTLLLLPVRMFQDMYCLSVKSYQLLLLEKEKKFAPVLSDFFSRSYFGLHGV